MLVHLGLSWFFTPYSQFVHMFLPLLFFVAGAVSFYSFKRAPSLGNYSLRRLLSVVMPYYVIVIAAFIFIWLIELRVPQFHGREILDWLFIDPERDHMPFPMGQVWFIHAMAIMVVVSLPVFAVSRKLPWPLLLGTFCSVLLTVVHQIFDVSHYFYLLDHNFYQALSNISFFFFGAFFFCLKEFFTAKVNFLFLSFCLFLLIFSILVIDVDINMAKHSYAPTFYYVSGGFFSIFLVVTLKSFITKILNNNALLNKFVIFLSDNAYAIFMIHSLIIMLSEKYLNLVDVAGRPIFAIAKIIIVVFVSCLISAPITRACKLIVKNIQDFIFSLKSSFVKSNIFNESSTPD
jgi:peptidoglycan/LPS O-acetylase OafA/YrhL